MDTTHSLKLPPKSYRRTIEKLSVAIPDPVLKLKFLKQALNEYQEISSQGCLNPSIAGVAFRKKLLENAEELWPGSKKVAKKLLESAEKISPGSKKAAKKLTRTDVTTSPDIKSRFGYKLRYIIGSVILLFFILGVGTAVSPLLKSFNPGAPINLKSRQAKTTKTKIIIRKPILYSRPSNTGDSPTSTIVKAAKYQNGDYKLPINLQNPILVALTSQQTDNSTSDRISQNPILSSHPRNKEDGPGSSKVKPAKYQTGVDLLPEYFKNPILAALTSQQTKDSTSDLVNQKTALSSRPPESENQSSSSIVKPARDLNGPGQILKYSQSPILVALTSQQILNSKSNRIIRKPPWSSLPLISENQTPSSAVKSVQFQNGPGQVPEYAQSPILVALVSQQTKNSTWGFKTQKTALSSRPSEIENHSPSSIGKTANYQNESDQSLKYFINPILLALAPQQIQNYNPHLVVKKPALSSRTTVIENQSTSPVGKTEKFQSSPGQVPEYLQIPILVALTSQQTKISTPDHINQKPISSSPSTVDENQSASSSGKTANYQNGPELVLNYLQNPILSALTPQQINISKTDRITQKPLLPSKTTKNENHSPSPVVTAANYQNRTEQVPEYLQNPVWLVEKTSDREFYSNRLQIITTHTISNVPRGYYRFPKNSYHPPANSRVTDKISGIVFHASESDLYPFMPEMNHSILKYSKQLIKYLLRKKSYHFFIDRFGRVYRLIQEDHAAFHAGNSIWADDEEIYLNLNHAFIGICFEGKDFEEINISGQKMGKTTKSKSTILKPTGITSFNEAQLRSGKELTDWLRVKYNIPQHNCVPHALTSVNPDGMLIGWHLDLSRGFPFEKFGLSDKYQEALPSMVEFGFFYDGYFERVFNGRLWQGIHWSEEILLRRARRAGVSFDEYRKSLHQRFSRYSEWNKRMIEEDQLAATP